MAYIIGFFCADGSMYKNKRGSCFITFEIIDKELLEKIASLLGAGQKISMRKRNDNWSWAWRIQIGSKKIFQKFLSLGITAAKAKRLQIPCVPQKFLTDFIRGYFDGDGNVQFGRYIKSGRKKSTPVLLVRFASASRGMLKETADKLHKYAGMRMKNVYKSFGAWRLDYSTQDGVRFYKFIYKDETEPFLKRKKQIFEEYPSLLKDNSPFSAERAVGVARLTRVPVTDEIRGSNPLRPAL